MDKKYVKIRAIVCGALLTGASTGIFSNSIAVFITSVCAELGASRGSFTLITSITLLFSMASLPLFGRLLTKANIKRLIALSAFICVGCVLTYSFCREIWQFYAAAAVYGLFVNGITLLSSGMLLRRLNITISGAVSGIAFSAAGVFSFFFLPLLQRTVSEFGWRWGYRLQAASGALILLIAMAIMPKPQAAEARPAVAFAKLFKRRKLLYAAAALFIANAVNLALFNHSSANLIGLGMSAASAAAVTSWAALLSSVSKPLFGISADRLGLKSASVILTASLFGACFAALALPFSRIALFVFTLLLSVSACSNSIPANLFAAKLFDDSDYPSAASALTLASTAGSAIGPPIAGAVYDRFGSYSYMWSGCAASTVVSGILLIFSLSCAERSK